MIAQWWGWVRWARLKILGIVFSLGLVLAAAGAALAYSTTGPVWWEIWSQPNYGPVATYWNNSGLYLYYGNQGSPSGSAQNSTTGFGWSHIQYWHGIWDPEYLQTVASYLTQATQPYWGPNGNLDENVGTTVVNDNTGHLMTVFMHCSWNAKYNEWMVITAYPMQAGETAWSPGGEIYSATTANVQKITVDGVGGKSQFPSWFNNGEFYVADLA